MINENYIQGLQYELEKSHTIFEWSFSGFGGRNSPLIRWCLVTIPAFSLFGLMLLSDVEIGDVYFWILFVVTLCCIAAGRYLFFPDRTYNYCLTPVGIRYKEQVCIPDTAYAVVRAFSWFGIAVCIIALFLVGPLAFVGVGGCALLSFGLTNFKPQVEELEVYFSDHVVVFDPIKDTVVEINTTADFHPKFIRTIFFKTFDDKKEFIECLKNCHDNVEHHQLKRLNDQYKHPMFNRELTDD